MAEQDVFPACRELGIGVVPYSPLGRGMPSPSTPSEGVESGTNMQVTDLGEGGPSGTRTLNSPVKSRLLCQLS